MKTLVVLSVLALAISAAVLDKSPAAVVSSADSDELDPFTAATLETFGGYDDEDEDTDDDPFQTEDHFDGTSDNEVIHANVTDDGMIEVEDMILSPEMFDVMFPEVLNHPEKSSGQSIHRRAGISSKSKLWPGGRIAYAYHTKLSGSQSKVRAAMDEWEKYTCLKFQYRKSTETKYVQFRTKFDSDGKMVGVCSSSVGYRGRLQYINLAKNCFGHKTILHEIGHTLGLIHEHQHPNRDSYVTILWDNINPKKKPNFNARKSGVSSWGIKYDPTSVMHYRSGAFRISGCKKPCYTITSKKGSTVTNTIGKAKHLSPRSDIPIIKKMYNCPASSG